MLWIPARLRERCGEVVAQRASLSDGFTHHLSEVGAAGELQRLGEDGGEVWIVEIVGQRIWEREVVERRTERLQHRFEPGELSLEALLGAVELITEPLRVCCQRIELHRQRGLWIRSGQRRGQPDEVPAQRRRGCLCGGLKLRRGQPSEGAQDRGDSTIGLGTAHVVLTCRPVCSWGRAAAISCRSRRSAPLGGSDSHLPTMSPL